MRPGSFSFNSLNSAPTDPAKAGDQGQRYFPLKCNENSTSLVISKQGVVMSFAAPDQIQALRVGYVFGARYVLQIVGMVVQFITVFMVDHTSFGAWAIKSSSNEAMNKIITSCPSFRQYNVKVAPAMLSGPQYSADNGGMPIGMKRRRGTHYISEVAGLVIKDTGNWFPNFSGISRMVWHSLNVLSGCAGLTTASTVAGPFCFLSNYITILLLLGVVLISR